MKGRKPDPKRKARGTGNRPHAGDLKVVRVETATPDFLPPPPEPPADLPEGAKDIWRAMLADVDPRILKSADLEGLRMLVVAALRHRELTEQVTRYGTIVQGMRGPMVNPAIDAANKQAATYVRLAEQYALTLQARMRTGLVMAQGATLVDQLRSKIGSRE